MKKINNLLFKFIYIQIFTYLFINKMSSDIRVESKEPNKEEIQKILKQNILEIFNQIKKGCSRKICYNIYCFNNLICKNSNYITIL